MYMRLYACICGYVHLYIYMLMCKYMRSCACICAHVQVYILMCMYKCTHAYICVFMLYIYIYVCANARDIFAHDESWSIKGF